MGNHLGPLSEASDRPVGQEWDVGGPDQLQGVNLQLFVLNKTLFWWLTPGFWAWEITWHHFQKPQVWGPKDFLISKKVNKINSQIFALI